MSVALDEVKTSGFLIGGGEMGALMRAHDWSTSPLGEPETWPQPLRTVVSLMLAAGQPMFIAWGPQRTLLYNDAYALLLADRHPAGLGRPFFDVWSDIENEIAPLFARVFAGDPVHMEDIELRPKRPGRPLEAHFAFSYTPVRDATDEVGGLFCVCTETTDHVLADRRRAADAERQHRLFEQAPGFITILSGPELRFEFVNEAYNRLFGRREFIGRSVREVFPDLEGQPFFDLLENAYATGERFVARAIPISIQTTPEAEPSEHFLDFIYEPVRDEAGAVTGLFIEGHDVSEAHVAQVAIRDSEARFRGVIDGMAEGFGLLGPDFTILDLNAEAMRLETRPREAIIGKTHWEAYPGSEESEIGRLYKRAMAERIPVSLEHRYEWEDGRVAWLDMRAYPSADGTLAIFYRDVSDRKRSESDLRDTAERLRLAVDNAEVGFWDVDLVNDHLVWPAQTKAMFGISPAMPVTMQDFYDGLHPDDLEATSRAYAAAADPKRRALYDVEYRTIGKDDGIIRWVAAKGRGVFDEAGRCLRVAGTAIDITARKSAETRLRESEARHRFRVELGDALRGLTTPSEIMAAVAERLGPHLGVDQANYYAIDGDRFVVTEEWRTPASHGMTGDHLLADFGELTVARIRAGETLRLDETRIVQGAEAFAAAGMAAVLSVPLHKDRQWAAGLHVHQSHPRAWSDAEEALLREVAAHAWSAIERVRAEADLRESEARQAFLLSLSDTLRSLGSPVAIASAAAERLGERFGLSRVFYAEYFGSVMRVERDFTQGVDSIVGEHDLAEFGPEVLRAYHECPIVKVDDVATDARFNDQARAGLRARQVGAYLDVVLFEDDKWVSLLAFQSATPRKWTAAEEALFEEVGERVRSAIERARAEEQLRQFNEKLETQVAERTAERDRMWETSPDLMLIIDFEGVFRRVNPAWTILLGYEAHELVGCHVNQFVVPDDHPKTVEAYELAAAGGRPVVENRYRHKDGSIRWISWSAAPGGELTYATGRDITLEKEREAELAQAQEALRQSQKMEAMGSLTGGVAHDFNNLLTPIIGSLDMLVRKGVGSERERRLIDGALQSAERAKTLVQRLLAFARRQPLQPVAVDIGRLVDGMAGLIGSTLGPNIDIRVDIAPDLPAAKADSNQLEMALLNLAVNARDAMPEGGELTIAANRESIRAAHKSGVKPGHYVRLRVNDTGVGMDEATLARAVEPFFSTKGIGQGTGLGLSMVHGLAAQLGGGLTIESVPGRGTIIELWLPMSGTVVGDEEKAESISPTRVGRGMALLVDDEELVRMSTADMLIDLGFEVVEAGSAEEALTLIKEGVTPDLLVTDHLMPGMNGADLAREARVLKPALPVLVVSGYAEVEGVAAEWPRLTKPFRNAELAASVAALIPATEA